MALAFAAPALARKKPAPPTPPAAPIIPQVHSGDAGVDAFYYYQRKGAPLWLASEDGRLAAQRIAVILRRAPIDGLAEGPVLASSVESAILRGTTEDDALISVAWTKYVRALKRPAPFVDYGDPALALKAPLASQVLSEAAASPSLAVYADRIASVNSFYSTLRETALAAGSAENPHVKATLDRLRLIPASGRAIVVDLASAQLWMVENGQTVDGMKVIVGKTGSPTPLLAGTINYVTFNPYWHILDEVARRKVAPIVIKRGVSYLKAARYDTVTSWSDSTPIDPKDIDWKAVAAGDAHAFIRQRPGVNNMMGAMKFSFVNDQDIFLHDTPHKNLFAKNQRTLSLGCVRLEHADRLAQWLLGRDAAPPSDAPELHVQIDHGVPVYLTYLSARVDDGQLAFANDYYNLDPAIATAAASPAADTATSSGSR